MLGTFINMISCKRGDIHNKNGGNLNIPIPVLTLADHGEKNKFP
jgi:hypothetical protein